MTQTLEEYREKSRQRSLKYYHKVKDDPEFKAKRRERDRKRYRKMMEEFKNQFE